MLIVDFETASLETIDVGTYAYLAHPSTVVAVLALKNVHTGYKGIWDRFDSYNQNANVINEVNQAVVRGTDFWAHNAQFEFPCFELFPSRKPRSEQWNCTAATARRAGLPSGLGIVTKLLGIETKDTAGKELINFFHSVRGYNWLMDIPQPIKKGKPKPPTVKIEGEDISFEDAFLRYGSYCLKDVDVTDLLRKQLDFFIPRGDTKKSFTYDLEMNQRGFPVDVRGLEIAAKLLTHGKQQAREACNEDTGLNPTQGAKLMVWMAEQGYKMPNMQAATVAAALEDESLPDTVRHVLEIRQGASFAAVDKIPTMLKSQVNGRVNGGFLWSGAVRTHRTAGKGAQPQNFKRPDKYAASFTKAMLADLPPEELIDIHGPLIERLANSVRHFIREPDGPMWDVDFSQIESRLTLYVCGQEDRLDDYRAGLCAYSVMATKIFAGTDYATVKAENGIHRFVGKQSVLLCGYAGGAKKFADTCKGYGQDIGIDLAEEAVSGYRLACPKVHASWKLINRAAIAAILTRPDLLSVESRKAFEESNFNDDDTSALDGKVVFEMHKEKTGLPVLLAHLYSGHILSYPMPTLKMATGKKHVCKFCRTALKRDPKYRLASCPTECQREFRSLGIRYKKLEKGVFKDEKTHGGVILENCVAGNTEVLTENGWKKIVDVGQSRVFDGENFVTHSGLTKVKYDSTIDVGGVRMTQDHLVHTHEGWTAAKDTDIKSAYGYCNRLPLPSSCRVEMARDSISPGFCEPVYDLMNCGPNNRFMVRGKDGPFIVHNCCQALAGDHLNYALKLAKEAGFLASAVIHDQAFGPFRRGQILAHLKAAFETVPPWSPGFPLKADEKIVEHYTKD